MPKPSFHDSNLQPQIRRKEKGKALTFCGNLILRVGDFVCFARTNSSDWKRVLFLAGIIFVQFSLGSCVLLDFVFLISWFCF